MKELSNKFHDRPLNSMDEARYWVEYIIKYGGKALKSPALDLPWWKIALLDVYLILFIVGNVILLVFIISIVLLTNTVHSYFSYVANSKKKN